MNIDELVKMPKPKGMTWVITEWEARQEKTYQYTADQLRAYGEAIARAVAERCAALCELQAAEPECPERATYCADAIRREFLEVSNG